MATNLQDYSRGMLSPDFIEVFATKNFSHIIEEWVLNSSRNIGLFVAALARESKARSSAKSTQMIVRYLSDNIFILSEQIRNECQKRTSSLSEITQSEFDFLTVEYEKNPVFETICIYDWIHVFSFDDFQFETDNSIIHLLFNVSQRDTFCECPLVSNSTIDHVRVSERMLTVRLETPRSFEGPESYFKAWSRLLSLLNDPIIEQRWNRYLLLRED